MNLWERVELNPCTQKVWMAKWSVRVTQNTGPLLPFWEFWEGQYFLEEPSYHFVLASAYIGVGHLSYSCYEFYNKLFQVPRPISARDQSFQYYSCHNQKRRVKTKIGIARTNDNDQQSAIFIKAIIINIILKLNKIKDYFIRKTLNNL